MTLTDGGREQDRPFARFHTMNGETSPSAAEIFAFLSFRPGSVAQKSVFA